MKTYLEKLYAGLAKVRRKSGDMQKLATTEVYYLRKIVVFLETRHRFDMDHLNQRDRKIRRLSKLVDMHRALNEEYAREVDQLKADKVRELSIALSQINTPKNLAPSLVPGLDL